MGRRTGQIVGILAAACLGAAAGRAGAEEVFSDDFEQPAYVPGPLPPQGGWASQGKEIPTIQDAVAHSGKQAAALERRTSRGDSIFAWKGFTAPEGRVHVQMRLRATSMPTTGDWYDAVYFYHEEFTADRVTILYLHNSGEVRIYDGPDIRPIGTWSNDTWHAVDFTVDFKRRTFDVGVGGQEPLLGVSFMDESTTSFGGIAFQEYGGREGGALYVDDVRVEVIP